MTIRPLTAEEWGRAQQMPPGKTITITVPTPHADYIAECLPPMRRGRLTIAGKPIADGKVVIAMNQRDPSDNGHWVADARYPRGIRRPWEAMQEPLWGHECRRHPRIEGSMRVEQVAFDVERLSGIVPSADLFVWGKFVRVALGVPAQEDTAHQLRAQGFRLIEKSAGLVWVKP